MLKYLLIGSILVGCSNAVSLTGEIRVVGNEPFTKYMFFTSKGNYYIDKDKVNKRFLYKKVYIIGEIVTITLKIPNGKKINIKKILPKSIKVVQ